MGTEELSPFLIGTYCHVTHFANFLALLPSYPDSPTIVFCLPRSGPFSLQCEKAGNYYPLRFLVHCAHNPSFQKAPSNSLPSRPSCHCLSHQEADEFYRHGAFSLLCCLSRRERLTTKNALGPSVLKVTNISQPYSSLASSRILLKSTSVSSGPRRDSNSPVSTFKLLLSSRYCFVFAMIVLSFALHIWSSTSKFPVPFQITSTSFAMVWAASFFFSITEALSLVVLQTTSLPAYLYQNEHAFWRSSEKSKRSSQESSRSHP